MEDLCPLCKKKMRDFGRELICEGKRYVFPFQFHHCINHGIYVWQEQGSKHELFDLSKGMNQIGWIESLKSEVLKKFFTYDVHMPTAADYQVLKLKCPNCKGGPQNNGEWKQQSRYFAKNVDGETVRCPWCSVEIPKGEYAKKL